ncbi:hypothetical protein [Streptomyces sp. NPDC088739]|uniref:hypothetical protein n=1 Tax=Streptomyces sp. NPDC088739 TaxID=3365882 RepID=UPI0038058F21
MSTTELTPAQTKAVAAMRKNNGWAKKGGDVSRQTFGALVTKGAATWTINTPGGHWAGHLTETTTDDDTPDAAEVAQTAAWTAARNQYPAAHDFLYLSEDEKIYGWTFRAGLGSGAKIGWVAVDGRVCTRTLLTRHDATLAARTYTARSSADATPRDDEFTTLGHIQAAAEAVHPAANLWRRVQQDGTTIAWTFRTGHGLDDPYTSILTDGTLAPSAGHPDRTNADTVARAHHQDHIRGIQLRNAQTTVRATYPNAHEFEDNYRDGQMIGWTFRTGGGPRARYSWVTLTGTFGRGAEPYRSEAAALLPMAVLDDTSVAARRSLTN